MLIHLDEYGEWRHFQMGMGIPVRQSLSNIVDPWFKIPMEVLWVVWLER